MACDGRFATAWAFSGFWCVSSILTGEDNSGLAAQAALTDSELFFIQRGVRANVGMVLYNLTANTSGVVTDVTEHTITAVGVTWNDGDTYRIVPIDKLEIARIEHFLDIAASDIHMAMAAAGACDCTLADWASREGGYLEKLNIIEAAMYFTCSCMSPDLSTEEKATLFEWASRQIDAIRNGKTELCQGATGAEFPVIGWAEIGWTEFNRRDIIVNRIMRNRS